MSSQPPHLKYILRVVALLTESNEGTAFRTVEVYEAYTRVRNGLTPTRSRTTAYSGC